MKYTMNRGVSSPRNLVSVALLAIIVIAIVLVLNRPQPNAVIVSKDLAPPMPGSPLAEQYPLTSMLFVADIRNDGRASNFTIEVAVTSADQHWTRSTQLTLDQGQSRQVIIDFGKLENLVADLEYEIIVTPN